MKKAVSKETKQSGSDPVEPQVGSMREPNGNISASRSPVARSTEAVITRMHGSKGQKGLRAANKKPVVPGAARMSNDNGSATKTNASAVPRKGLRHNRPRRVANRPSPSSKIPKKGLRQRKTASGTALASHVVSATNPHVSEARTPTQGEGGGTNTNNTDPDSAAADNLLEAELVQEESQAFRNSTEPGTSVVQASPVPDPKDLGYRELLMNRKARIGLGVFLLAAVIIMAATILALAVPGPGDGTLNSNDVVPIADPTVGANVKNDTANTSGAAAKPPLSAGVAPFLDHVFEDEGFVIPDSTHQALEDQASPQWLAQDWLYQDPNLEEIPPLRVIQRFGLATLYYSTTGEKWDTNSLWLDYSAHECDWFFANPPCRFEDKKFQELYLVGNNLDGTIPAQIFLLPHLTVIEVADNRNLGGTIPAKIGYSNELLAHVAIHNTGVEGSIPTQVGEIKNLQSLFFTGNPLLSGTIPTEVGNLSTLFHLGIFETSTSGTIPTELGLLSLHDILIGSNKLSGSIPSQLGLLTELTSLIVHYNTALAGTISSQLGVLTKLAVADFQKTSLTGPIPASFCQRTNDGLLTLGFQETGLYCGSG